MISIEGAAPRFHGTPTLERGTRRTAFPAVMAVLALALGACTEDPTAPATSSSATLGTDSVSHRNPTAAASYPLAVVPLYWGEYRWSKGDLAVPMGGTASTVCFLTTVGGSLQGRDDWVGIVAAFGTWYLTGSSSTGDVRAGAHCIRTTGYTAEISVSSSNGVGGGQLLPARACGLTQVGGDFDGGFSVIRIGDNRALWAHSEFSYVRAAARCALGDIVSTGSEWAWWFSAGDVQITTSASRLCVLTGLIGVFEDSADEVRVERVRGWWQLTGSPTDGTDGAWARCIHENPRTGVTKGG